MPEEKLDHDVVIVGGGVAGCATSMALKKVAPELTVAIVEREAPGGGQPDLPRIGETLPPQVVTHLQYLGLWEGFRKCGFLPAYGTSAAWGSDEIHHNEFLYSPFGHGWHLDRLAFDRWMRESAADSGAVFFSGKRIAREERAGERWSLELHPAEGVEKLNSRFVVDATGRAASFAGSRGAGKQPVDKLVGLYRFYELPEGNHDPGTLVESEENGWWYSAVLPNQRLVVALMTDSDIASENRIRETSNWEKHLNRTRHTAGRVSGAVPFTEPHVRAAHTQRLEQVTGDGWLAVGDAMLTFDPLASLGIFKALRSARYASFAIADDFNGNPDGARKYQALADSEYDAYRAKHREYYDEEQRFPNSRYWQRRREEGTRFVREMVGT